MLAPVETERSRLCARLLGPLLALPLLFSLGCGSVAPASEDEARSAAVETGEIPLATTSAFSEPVDPNLAPWCRDGESLGRVIAEADVLSGLSIYQGVEIPLFPPSPGVDVVAGRDALVRIAVAPTSDPVDGARLVLSDSEGENVFDVIRPLSGSSKDSLSSTYNFFLEGAFITPETELSVELFRNVPCGGQSDGGARFPQSEKSSLHARLVGALELMMVPVRFEADGSGRISDTSEVHLEELRSALQALYPVPEVVLHVHEPVATDEESLEGVLSQIMHLRENENAPSHLAYFGLVDPGETMADYCEGACVAGVSAVGSASGVSSSGVGVGFRGAAVETFLHELGHIHRLDHAPCGAPAGVDTTFPHEAGRIGSWGFDMRDRTLKDPAGDARDFMSYCDPTWISDHNYQKLVERISLSNSLTH